MATATDTLKQEHRGISKMLEMAEIVATKIEKGEKVNPDVLANFLEFFQIFVDKCHHGKEEGLFFPALEEKGIPREGGPIGVMEHEHTEGRQLVEALAEATLAYPIDADAGRRWTTALRAYSDLLRAHINKEDTVLFMMADRILGSEEQRNLNEEFEKLEANKIGVGTHERLHDMIKQMAKELAA